MRAPEELFHMFRHKLDRMKIDFRWECEECLMKRTTYGDSSLAGCLKKKKDLAFRRQLAWSKMRFKRKIQFRIEKRWSKYEFLEGRLPHMHLNCQNIGIHALTFTRAKYMWSFSSHVKSEVLPFPKNCKIKFCKVYYSMDYEMDKCCKL